MATPEGNLDIVNGSAGAEVANPLSVDSSDAWILELGINDPVPGALESDRAIDSAPESAPPADPTADAPPAVPLEAAPAVEGTQPPPAQESVPETELSASEKETIEKLPEDERPAMVDKIRKQHFMDHYLNPDKPAAEIAKHLEERSPSRFSQLEASIFEQRLSQPEQFAALLFEKSPDTYSKLASEVYRGDPGYFTRQITGRDGYTPETVQAAIDFYERNKDLIEDAGSNDLPTLDADTLAQMEEYFPDQAAFLRNSAQLAAENAQLKQERQARETPADPNAQKLALETQQQEIQREIDGLWDLGRDTVGQYVEKVAFDPSPTVGAGIHVTPEERKASPYVAMLKDLKAHVLFNGIDVDGKSVLGDFAHDFTEWGKNNPELKEGLSHWSKFAQARERNNVVDVARKIQPLAGTYYQERLKNPIFAAIDGLISREIERGSRAPVFDRQIAGHVPAPQGGGVSNTGGDSWLIQDAIRRAG